MKRCFKCQQEKPLAGFYKHSDMADGHLNKCIECTKLDVKAHRLQNLDRIRDYDKQRANHPHRKAQRERIFSQWRADHPERRAAHSAVGRALRASLLLKLPCELCGHARAEAHHPDYSRPLLVTWLCRPHHMQIHAEALTANHEH